MDINKWNPIIFCAGVIVLYSLIWSAVTCHGLGMRETKALGFGGRNNDLKRATLLRPHGAGLESEHQPPPVTELVSASMGISGDERHNLRELEQHVLRTPTSRYIDKECGNYTMSVTCIDIRIRLTQYLRACHVHLSNNCQSLPRCSYSTISFELRSLCPLVTSRPSKSSSCEAGFQ
jgi:hypothetical protein